MFRSRFPSTPRSSPTNTWRWIIALALATLSALNPVALAQTFATLPSRMVDQPGFAYTASPTDWREVPLYQVITDRFYDGDPGNNDDNPDGTYNPAGLYDIHGGDFEGLKAKLDYIQMLGARGIWISPVVRNVHGEFHGFAATDFNAIDPHWGTLADLRSFIDAAHARGIYVVIDVVQNHAGDRIGSYNGGFPAFNSGGYTLAWWNTSRKHAPPFDDLSRFYNFGQIDNWSDPVQVLKGDFFSLDGINTELPVVRQDMITIHTALIAATDCDGFRVDTARHVEMEFWETFLPSIDSYATSIGKSNFIVYAEAWVGSDSELAPFTESNRFNSVLHFPLRDTMENVFVWGAPTAELTTRLDQLSLYNPAARDQIVQFIDNHDMPRVLNGGKLADNQALLTAALSFLYTSGRVPCLYYGTEQGFNGGGDPYDREDMFDGDFEFGPSDGDNFDMTTPLLRHVRTLNLLRLAHPTLVKGQLIPRHETTGGRGLYVYSMILGTNEAVVAINTAGSLQTAEDAGLGPQTTQPPGTVMADLLQPADTVTVGQGGAPDRITFTVPAYGTRIWAPQIEGHPLPPTVTAAVPAHAAVDAARGTKITLTFDQPMDASSTEAAFNLTPAASGQFVWASPTEFHYVPFSALAAHTLYTVRLEATARSAAGQAVGAPFQTHFTTGTTIGQLELVTPRQYTLDGAITGDEAGALRVTVNGVSLYVDFNGKDLYFATQAADNANDRFIFVTTQTSGSSPAPWAKSGQVSGLQHYLGNEVDNGWSGWFHNTGGGGFTASVPGGWLEGTLDPITAFGYIPATLYIASAAYSTPNGGSLHPNEQCPSGDADGDLESGEYYLLDLSLFDTDADGLTDLQEDANANGQFDPGESHPLSIDTDTDGMSDGDEYIAGTDASDPDSLFVSEIDFQAMASQVTLRWMGVAGHVYTVWAAHPFPTQPAHWTLTSLTNVPGTGTQLEYTEPVTNSGTRVFRVQVSLE